MHSMGLFVCLGPYLCLLANSRTVAPIDWNIFHQSTPWRPKCVMMKTFVKLPSDKLSGFNPFKQSPKTDVYNFSSVRKCMWTVTFWCFKFESRELSPEMWNHSLNMIDVSCCARIFCPAVMCTTPTIATSQNTRQKHEQTSWTRVEGPWKSDSSWISFPTLFGHGGPISLFSSY